MARSYSPPQKLREYQLYEDQAKGFWKRALSDPVNPYGFSQGLTGSQKARLKQWQQILAAANLLDESDKDSLDVSQLGELTKFIGGGVWHIDYTREIISYHNFWSSVPVFESAPARVKFDATSEKIQIPFGRGVIGYYLENLPSFCGLRSKEEVPYYLAHNSVGDLRGAVTIEDQFLGHINVLLIPILVDESRFPQLALSLYLPIPSVFTDAFCSAFSREMQWVGKQILTAWKSKKFDSLFPSVPPEEHSIAGHEDTAQHFQSKLRKVCHSVTAGRSAGPDIVAFPWVALLNTEPVAPPNDPRVLPEDPFETWIAHDSFIRARMLGHMRRMLNLNWAAHNSYGQEFVRECGLGPIMTAAGLRSPPDTNETRPIFLSQREWDPEAEVCDIVLWCADDTNMTNEGMIRVHLSRPLLASAALAIDEAGLQKFLDDALTKSVRKRILLLLSQLGSWLFRIRHETRADPIAIKLQRELEHQFFTDVFDQVAEQATRNSHSRGKLQKHAHWETQSSAVYAAIQPALTANAPKQDEAESLFKDTVRALDAILSLELRDGQQSLLLSSLVVGFSYWSFTTEVVLAEKEKRGVQATSLSGADASRYRDIQRAISYLAISELKRRQHNGDRDPWKLKWQLKNRTQLHDSELHDKSISECSDPVTWHLFVPNGNGQSDRTELQKIHISSGVLGPLPLKLEVQLIGATGTLTQHWQIFERWPRIRAYGVLGVPTDRRKRDHNQTVGESRLYRHLSVIRKRKLHSHDFWVEFRKHCMQGMGGQQGHLKIEITVQEEKVELTSDHVIPPPLKTAVEHAVGHELRGIRLIYAFPIQILRHVYAWMLVGTLRPQALSLLSAEMNAIEARLRAIAVETATTMLESSFADFYELRDIDHTLKRPAIKMRQVLREVQDLIPESAVSRSQLETFLVDLNKETEAIANWCVTWVDARHPVGGSMWDVLSSAFELAKSRFVIDVNERRRDWLGNQVTQCQSLGQTLRSIDVSKADEDGSRRFLIALLLSDLISNAAKHSPDVAGPKDDMRAKSEFLSLYYSRSGSILRLSLHNLIQVSEIEDAAPQSAFLDVIDHQLNQSLALEAVNAMLLGTEGNGLRNIYAWSRRLRVPLNYEVFPRDRPQSCRVTIDLSHFL